MTLNLDKSSWRRAAFGDVVHSVNETVRDADAAGIDRLIAMEHLDPGELRVERWGSIAVGTTFTRRVRPGQTLFGKRRAYQRKVAYAEFDAICSGDILTFEADSNQMLPEFLPFLCQSDEFFAHALGTSAGSLSPRTNWRDLSSFEFDLPPLDEQSGLADLLWGLALYSGSHQDLAATQARAASVYLDSVLADSGTETALEGVVAGIVDCAHNTAPTDPAGEGRVVGTPDVRDGRIDIDSARRVSDLTYRQWTERAIPRAGDLIFTREAPVGEVGIVPDSERLCLGQRTVLIQPKDRSQSSLIWAILRSEAVQALIQTRAAGSTVPHLNVSDIRSLPVPWPATVEGAERVRKAVAISQRADTAIRVERKSAAALRASLLADMFGGV